MRNSHGGATSCGSAAWTPSGTSNTRRRAATSRASPSTRRNAVRRTLALAGLVTLALAGTARAEGPLSFNTVKLLNPTADGSTEPRITITPDGTRYVVTNSGGNEVVYASRDDGNSWTKTPADPPGQTAPTIDVDIIGMPTGRILSSELDFAGVNFPTAVSDDGGKTWTQSTGPQLVDQDRQWFAAGP